MFRPDAAEIARLKARVEKQHSNEQLRDNHFYAGLYSRTDGIFSDVRKPSEWIKDGKDWIRIRHRLRRREWIEKFFPIRTKAGEIKLLTLNPAQRMLEARIIRMERAGVPVRVMTLKARQTGISTYAQGLMFERVLRGTHVRGLIVADNKDRAETLLAIAQVARSAMVKDRTSGELWNFRMTSKARDTFRFDDPMVGEVEVTTAEAPAAGRGGTRTMLHLCLVPSTPILVEHGRILPVCHAQIGQRVITHNGNAATISRITVSEPTLENGGGRTVRITPWLGHEIELTPNHPVFTQRGWVSAGEVGLDDLVSMPRRKITHELRSMNLPVWTRNSPRGSGRAAFGMGDEIALNEETGFAFGYYLAEGSLHRNKEGASAVTFHRHRREGAYAERATQALRKHYISRRVVDLKTCLTTNETIYSASLARFIEQTFGSVDEKHIPDWTFRAGDGFARGLLAGYLSGDGSKVDGKQGKYRLSSVCATSIRSSLTTQVRDLAAALGYGWGAIDFKQGAKRYGRVEQDAWIVRWTGKAARALRPLMGLDVADNGRPRSEKSYIQGDHVWIRIRKIEEGDTKLVYDVEVDHEDHSFRTLYFSVKNSETAWWKRADQVYSSCVSSLPVLPGTIGIDESTANGDKGRFRNDFWKSWREREVPLLERTQPWSAMFFAFWQHPEYRWTRSYGAGRTLPENNQKQIEATLTQEEQWLLRQEYIQRWDPADEWERVRCHNNYDIVMEGKGPSAKIVETKRVRKDTWVWRRKGVGWRKVDYDQLAWRRAMIEDKTFGGDLDLFNQEYPSRPQVAFLSSGRPVFPQDLLNRMMDNAKKNPPLFRGTLRKKLEQIP